MTTAPTPYRRFKPHLHRVHINNQQAAITASNSAVPYDGVAF